MKTRRTATYLILIVLAAVTSPAQETPSPSRQQTPRTRVVLLGTGTPVPDPDRSGPATAIVVDDTAYLVKTALVRQFLHNDRATIRTSLPRMIPGSTIDHRTRQRVLSKSSGPGKSS